MYGNKSSNRAELYLWRSCCHPIHLCMPHNSRPLFNYKSKTIRLNSSYRPDIHITMLLSAQAIIVRGKLFRNERIVLEFYILLFFTVCRMMITSRSLLLLLMLKLKFPHLRLSIFDFIDLIFCFNFFFFFSSFMVDTCGAAFHNVKIAKRSEEFLKKRSIEH